MMKITKRTATKPKKKTVKGVTLVECIIAILVLAVSALLMVRVGQLVSALLTNSNHLNRKTVVEAPVAEARHTDGNLSEVKDDNMKISVTVAGKSVNIASQSYDTKKAVEEKTGGDLGIDYDVSYVVIDMSKTKGANVWTGT